MLGMSRLVEFLEDDDKQLSTYRLMFIFGCVSIVSMAVFQFIGLGSIPTALYSIIGIMTSGGYCMGKYMDMKSTTSGDTDAGN
jgi:hypothetical protein